jgi:hypothetical protein
VLLKLYHKVNYINVGTFKCDEELGDSSEIELTAKWCILKSRIKGYKHSWHLRVASGASSSSATTSHSLADRDFHLFASLKHPMAGKQFQQTPTWSTISPLGCKQLTTVPPT